MNNAIKTTMSVFKMLITPMTPTKFVKLGLLALIFNFGFNAWARVLAEFLGWFGLLAYPIAIVTFCACQWCECEPELLTIGCEDPGANLKKVKLARNNHVYAGRIRQDLTEEFEVTPDEIERSKRTQAIAFGIDLVMSSAGYWPFAGGLASILLAPLGFFDFDFFNAFMLIVTVFFTPRILISAMLDGRYKAAREVRA
ncbi:MAG: hypothetical protein AAFY26_20705 [Cyanobacteria bacterium J06638_22]